MQAGQIARRSGWDFRCSIARNTTGKFALLPAKQRQFQRLSCSLRWCTLSCELVLNVPLISNYSSEPLSFFSKRRFLAIEGSCFTLLYFVLSTSLGVTSRDSYVSFSTHILAPVTLVWPFPISEVFTLPAVSLLSQDVASRVQHPQATTQKNALTGFNPKEWETEIRIILAGTVI